jgi:hypothetical protein
MRKNESTEFARTEMNSDAAQITTRASPCIFRALSRESVCYPLPSSADRKSAMRLAPSVVYAVGQFLLSKAVADEVILE